MMEKILFSTNDQKVLSFLIQHVDEKYYDREISKFTGISKSGTNLALRKLAKEGLISREKVGRMFFYKALAYDIFIKYLKILQNIIFLSSLISKLKKISIKIILYGSASRGENIFESDIDIFIITRHSEEVEEVIFKDKLRKKIQYVIKSPTDFITMKKKDSLFCNEIEKGILLWEEDRV